MPPLQYGLDSGIGRATLICGWLFGVLTLVCICLVMWVRMHHGLKLDDCMLVAATIISFALLSQTTWAIVDEGQGQHVENESQNQVQIVVKVLFPTHIEVNLIDSVAVSMDQ